MDSSSLVWEAFDQAPAFIAVLRGPDHVFEYVNRAYLQLVGFRDLLGDPVREAVPEVEGQGLFELLDGVCATGEPFVGTEIPVALQREPGAPLEERYIDLVYQPLFGPDGTVTGVLAQGVDVTERVRANRAIVAAHRDHDLVMAHSRDVVCLADADGRFTRVSAASEAVFGYRPDELVGRLYMDLVHPDDRAFASAVGAEIRASTRVYSDLRHVRKDGSVVPVRWSSVWSEADQVLLGVARDRTESVAYEDALRESEERYRGIFDQNIAGVVFIGLDGRVTSPNSRFCEIVGHPEAALVGTSILDFTHPEDVDKTHANFSRLVAEGVPFSLDKKYVRQDGSTVWASSTVALVHDAAGRPRSAVALTIDISEQRQAEQEVRDVNASLKDQVREAVRDVRQLAARLTVAEQKERERIAQVLHDDLQQQLYGLSMVLSLLGRGPSGPDAAALSGRATEILGAATAMTRTLAAELSPAVLQSERVQDFLEWTATSKRAEYGLDISVEVTGDPVIADSASRVLLYQALREVLFNVVKHSGGMTARLVAWTEDGSTVVRVEDDGAGFDMAAVAASPGGFGLPSVHERLRLVGGRFEIDSAPGTGTRVSLSVPTGAPAPPLP
ncbi:MAG TPA: PAS domain S-box protein [Rubricoccaceae bacterium]